MARTTSRPVTRSLVLNSRIDSGEREKMNSSSPVRVMATAASLHARWFSAQMLVDGIAGCFVDETGVTHDGGVKAWRFDDGVLRIDH